MKINKKIWKNYKEKHKQFEIKFNDLYISKKEEIVTENNRYILEKLRNI